MALSFFAMTTLASFGYVVDFGSKGYFVADGRLVFYFPFEWAENEYSQDMPFPIDTDSIFGIITYWLPSDLSIHSYRYVDDSLWGRFSLDPWSHPLNFSTDGEYSETGARPVPLSLLVYLTAPVAIAMWTPWKRRRKGHCGKCGYDLAGLVAAGDGRVVCPECGAAWVSRAPSGRTL